MRNRITRRSYTRIYFLWIVPLAIIGEVAIVLWTTWQAGASLADSLGPLLEWIVFSLGASLVVYCVFYVAIFVIPPHPSDRE